MLKNFVIPDVFFQTNEPIVIPAPTTLYPIEPYEIGTWRCESLKSYLERIADEHRVSRADLVQGALGKALEEKGASGMEWVKWHFYENRGMVSMGFLTQCLASTLEDATNLTSLASCTMLPVSGILSPWRLLYPRQRLCRTCIKEDLRKNKFHGHLLWWINCVTACPTHGTELSESTCGAEKKYHIKPNFRKVLSGVCSCCGSIGYLCVPDSSRRASPLDLWKAEQVAELISCFPEAKKLFSPRLTIEGLNQIFEKLGNGKPAVAARKAKVSKSLLWGWMNGELAPALEPLLRICLSANVSLVSVLKGKPHECETPKCEWPKKSPRRAPTRLSRSRAEVAARAALESDPPSSLCAVSSSLKTDPNRLRRLCPSLCTLLVQRRRKWIVDQRKRKFIYAKKEFERSARKLKRLGKSVTHRNMCDLLRKPLFPRDLISLHLNNYMAKNRELAR